MSKKNDILRYINKCDEFNNDGDLNDILDFIKKIESIYSKEIPELKESLTLKIEFTKPVCDIAEARKNLDIMKGILQNYRENIKSGFIPNSLSNQSVNINQTLNSNNINENNNSNFNLTLNNVIEQITRLPSDVLSDVDKEILEDKISALEKAVNDKDKSKVSKKIKSILNFALDKGSLVIALVSDVISLLNDKILPLLRK